MTDPIWIDLLKLLAVALLVLANAFFVAAEFSLVSVRRTRIAELITEGNRSARWVQRAIHDPDRFIAATQLGITLASLGLGWIGEPALGDLIQPVVDLFPAEIESEVSHSISAGFSFAVITFLHVVIGELAPKSIALQSPERTSLMVARPTIWSEWIFRPAIWLLNGAGNALLRLLRLEPASGHEMVHSVAELKMLVTASADSGIVEDEAEEMLHAIFDFGDTLVRLVMIPRTEMVAIDQNAPLEEIISIAVDHPFTKLPVFRESLDHVIGVVHLKDAVSALHGGSDGSLKAGDLMREAIFIPETARINALLSLFRSRKQHIAIVLDEYGGTAGMVTLEDLLEEIVGEVGDPFDNEPEIQPMPDGTVLVDGLMPIEDVNEYFNLRLHDPSYDTIAGFVLGQLGRLAQIGDTVVIENIRLRVEAMDGLRIARVSIYSPPEKSRTRAGSASSQDSS
jgi:CBS domain containing-hemolysin-like protein